ncbi:murein hydrolase activator EnvC family protein [Heliophilum fasciatum]|uniref:Murein DD-endopeptidase MepM/ murein hydrolase activator NlpD n=1 Tax=Heliophilum fasciatum TaxID=35700 RepID=A0A4R2REI5_9FIRM|nr:M23 family metallopeptidase [Heliophilum fasciatum]MCW2279221.1 murein DD-endopeptidase MepM/ murein hydrolase activator NlpD [Heliophilum fasciatum]TCP60808.1 murein DD-endopeptidase MepM/ murein hydrolase activator NlpD [Heliophilum fasciatum]
MEPVKESPRRRQIAIGIILSMTVGFVGTCSLGVQGIASADELSERRQELNRVQNQVDSVRRDLTVKKQQERDLLGQLADVKQDISGTERAIYDLNRQTRDTEVGIMQAQKDIAEAQKDLDERVTVLKERLKDVYINGNVSYLEVMLESSNFIDFLTRLDLMQKFVEQDAKLVRQIEAQQQVLQEKVEDLEQKKNMLAQIKAQAEEKKSFLVSRGQEHQRLLNQVSADRALIARQLDELEAQSNQLVGIIRSLQSQQKRPKMGTGPMAYPLPSYAPITSPYGQRIHPVLRTSRFHTGVDFGAPSGTSILAAQAGVVIFAGSMAAYGNSVIIDHGGGVSTLYAHQSVIQCSEGQTVTKGQTIGRVGSTGWSTGAHLHFEVRVDGSHTNPMPYIGG